MEGIAKRSLVLPTEIKVIKNTFLKYFGSEKLKPETG